MSQVKQERAKPGPIFGWSPDLSPSRGLSNSESLRVSHSPSRNPPPKLHKSVSLLGPQGGLVFWFVPGTIWGGGRSCLCLPGEQTFDGVLGFQGRQRSEIAGVSTNRERRQIYTSMKLEGSRYLKSPILEEGASSGFYGVTPELSLLQLSVPASFTPLL